MGQDGWPFASADEYPGADVDPLHKDFKHIKDLYFHVTEDYKGRFVNAYYARRNFNLTYMVLSHQSDSPFPSFGTKIGTTVEEQSSTTKAPRSSESLTLRSTTVSQVTRRL